MEKDNAPENRGTGGRKTLMIVSFSPEHLERGVLWFQEHQEDIERARLSNPWWRAHALFLEETLAMAPARLIRALMDFGYERATNVRGQGLFAVRGGIVEVWPINTEIPSLIEFHGNVIATIRARTNSAAYSHECGGTPLHLSPALLPGSFVVHVDHGIGIFRGVVEEEEFQNGAAAGLSIPVSVPAADPHGFFVVEYAPAAPGREPDRLYVPVAHKDRLSPYLGFTSPAIHRLGSPLWEHTKRKVKEETVKFGQELLRLYAHRSVSRRPPHNGDSELEQALAAAFPYQETPDQRKATEEIMESLTSSKPMDRLLSGDVGFGKTEVAIRAALRVISSGKQVAVLAPTTVLAAQHERIFRERLAPLGVRVAMLSRLSRPEEQKRIIQKVREGVIECVIGTHRLFSHDILFSDLGLVIVDEEQRFGVRQKEYFTALRKELDVLSLSATPIPRTLQLTLVKLRDVSLLKTPPPGRLPIKTFLLPHSYRTIARAIRFEQERGGQIYVLHNRIETLEEVKRRLHHALEKLGSWAGKNPFSIGVIHGRMKEKEIVRAMDDFRARRYTALLATTIIENGLDISSANTLVVNDATRLGLAQAHQLRGRVGRGDVQAFAYFLYPPSKPLAERAEERLEALRTYANLGEGYELALRDLEMRGAGNILGKEQSGAVNKVGLNLYYQMLAETIEELKESEGL